MIPLGADRSSPSASLHRRVPVVERFRPLRPRLRRTIPWIGKVNATLLVDHQIVARIESLLLYLSANTETCLLVKSIETS